MPSGNGALLGEGDAGEAMPAAALLAGSALVVEPAGAHASGHWSGHCVVTLTGHVPTFADKMTAERIVARIKGVKGIAEEIDVRPVGTNLTADDEVAKRIVNVPQWTASVPTDAVKVKISKGWVTLSGTVEWNYQREAAERVIRGMSGVTGITNAVLISPRASAVDIRDRIEKAFKRDAGLEAPAIRVAVADGTVTLEGKVHSLSERRAAERAAWAAPGVRNVQDRLSIL